MGNLLVLSGLLSPIDMKVQSSIKKISPDDIIVRRKGRLFRINKKNPRHKARQ
jgi:large subunit ribosomal protein L36